MSSESTTVKTDAEWQYEKRVKRHAIRQLHIAIEENNIERVLELITPEIDVNFHYGGQSALQIAVIGGHFNICKVLINNGADVDKCDAQNNSLLNMAVWHNRPDIVNLLISHSAELDVTNLDGRTALNSAAYRGHCKVARSLVSANCLISRPDQNGHTPLITAAQRGHIDVVKVIIAATNEVELNYQDIDRHTALIAAASLGYCDVVNVLITAGCDINKQEKYGRSALYQASRAGHHPVVAKLIEAGADLNITDTKDATPLLEAVKEKHIEVIKLLIDAGCDLNLCERDSKQAAIHEAVRQACQYFGHAEEQLAVVRLLIAAGCDPGLKDKQGWSPLCHSAFGGEIEICRLLLAENVELELLTEAACTPLHMAMFGNKPEIVNMLLSKGSKVNVLNKSNETPLYTAVNTRAHIKIVSALLRAGSDLDVCERESGYTALYSSVHQGYTEATLALINAGCNINICSKAGRSVLCVACERSADDVIEALLAQPSCDVNAGHGYYPLLAAASHGYPNTVLQLLHAGANVNQMTEMSITALYQAIGERHMSVAKVLLSWGADPAAHCRVKGPRRCCASYSDRHPHLEPDPLYAALRFNQLGIMKLLLLASEKIPRSALTTIRDIIMRTGYAQDLNISAHVLHSYAEFFAIVLGFPRSLQAEARSIIRHRLGTNLSSKVSSLPLPTKLKDYVILRNELQSI